MTTYVELTAAELAYRTAARHWRRCLACRTVGGEWAALDQLCSIGRALFESWEAAEEVERRRMVAEDIRTGHATWLDLPEAE